MIAGPSDELTTIQNEFLQWGYDNSVESSKTTMSAIHSDNTNIDSAAKDPCNLSPGNDS
jgi:hypothetical protein